MGHHLPSLRLCFTINNSIIYTTRNSCFWQYVKLSLFLSLSVGTFGLCGGKCQAPSAPPWPFKGQTFCISLVLYVNFVNYPHKTPPPRDIHSRPTPTARSVLYMCSSSSAKILRFGNTRKQENTRKRRDVLRVRFICSFSALLEEPNNVDSMSIKGSRKRKREGQFDGTVPPILI